MDEATGMLLARVSRAVALKYLRCHPLIRWDSDTILGDALIGALEAHSRYDPGRGANLATYAARRALWAIQEGVRHRSVASREDLSAEPDLRRHPQSHHPLVLLADLSRAARPEQRDPPLEEMLDRVAAVQMLRRARLTDREVEVIVRCVMYQVETETHLADRYGASVSAMSHMRLDALRKIRRISGQR